MALPDKVAALITAIRSTDPTTNSVGFAGDVMADQFGILYSRITSALGNISSVDQDADTIDTAIFLTTAALGYTYSPEDTQIQRITGGLWADTVPPDEDHVGSDTRSLMFGLDPLSGAFASAVMMGEDVTDELGSNLLATLSRLQGYNAAADQYYRLAVNPDGEMLTTKSGSQAYHEIFTAAGTNETLVVDEPCILYNVSYSTADASTTYLKLYDVAATPVVGAGSPKMVVQCKANPESRDYSAGVLFESGLGFTTVGSIANGGTANAPSNKDVGLIYKLVG